MDVLSCEVSFEEIIKGSRFLSELIPCTSQTQAREIIKLQKAKMCSLLQAWIAECFREM